MAEKSDPRLEQHLASINSDLSYIMFAKKLNCVIMNTEHKFPRPILQKCKKNVR